MKMSLKNDKGMKATQNVDTWNNNNLPVSGPKAANSAAMGNQGKLLSFQNAGQFEPVPGSNDDMYKKIQK